MLEQLKKLANEKIRINGIGFFSVTIAYIYISIFIFLIGWVKPSISIPIIGILAFAIYEYYKYYKEKIKDKPPIYISAKVFVAICVIVFILGTIIGWTAIFNQTNDWIKHNAVLRDLTEKSWPVYYENAGENSMLTYYIGQYLVPSLVGKVFSSVDITQLANGLWAMVGLVIAILGTFKITKSDSTKKQFITLTIMFLFSTFVSLSQILDICFKANDISFMGHFIKFGNYHLEYSSNLILLRWVMPQCLMPWIILSILWDNPYDIKHYVLLCLPLLLYSSFSFVGLLFVLFVLAIVSLFKEKNIKEFLKNVFSFSNVIVTMTLGTVLLIYFIGNVLSDKPNELGLGITDFTNNWWAYFIFVIEIIPYMLLLFKDNKKNPFYWASTAILLILPFFHMGYFNDLVMRISIVPLFIYMILCINKLYSTQIGKKVILFLIILFSVRCHSVLHDLENVKLEQDVNHIFSIENFANRDLKIQKDYVYNYVSYDLENNLFVKYLAR